MSRGLGTSRVNLGCWGGERKFGGSSQVALVSEGFAEEFGGGVGIESRPEPGLWKVLNVGERSTDAWECFSCSPSALGEGVPCTRVISNGSFLLRRGERGAFPCVFGASAGNASSNAMQHMGRARGCPLTWEASLAGDVRVRAQGQPGVAGALPRPRSLI